MNLNVNNLLASLPASLREELFLEFNKLLKNFRERRWEPAELDGGKLCEIVYSILNGYTSGTYPNRANKPSNFYDACKAFESLTQFSRPIRIQIPRILIALYEVRNNRGVGHVGGDVNPNRLDATFVVYSAKWLLSELIRVFHQVSIDEATDAIEQIIQRETEVIWNIGSQKRVLAKGLDYKTQALLLLYSCVDGRAVDQELFEWVEHSNKSVFKSRILKELHKERLIEYDMKTGIAHISPNGIKAVEDRLDK